MDTWFIVWIIIYCYLYFILFLKKLAREIPFKLIPLSFEYVSIIKKKKSFSYFLVSQDYPEISCTSPVLVLCRYLSKE